MTGNLFFSPSGLARTCAALYRGTKEGEGKALLFASLAEIFGSLALREDVAVVYPRFGSLFGTFRASLEAGDCERVEDGLTLLYAYLHGADSTYAPGERAELDALGGYWCHAGGVSPLMRARSHIGPGSRVADYGAGNGLQGLLLQALYPHRQTTLIELSGPMVEKGRRLREMMSIAEKKVRWIHGSVTGVPPEEFDFIYIYRPLRPEGEEGRNFYEWFARRLDGVTRKVTIFSIADCLKDFLRPPFAAFYDDGQLTCFTNRPR